MTSLRLLGLSIFTLVILLAVVHAQTVTFEASPTLLEDEVYTVNYSVHHSPFTGTLTLGYQRVLGTPLTISLVPGSFTGLYANGTISVVGNQIGTYGIYGNLSNSSQQLFTASITGQVISSAPQVLTKLPTGTLTEKQAELQVQTDESATCKFDTSDVSYFNMANTFSETGSTIHNHTVSSLDQGTQIYYVRCRDPDQHEMNTSAKIEFGVDLPPTGAIKLSDTSPVQEGTIEVTLTLSESVDTPPTLHYKYGSNAPTAIALTGSDDVWTGFIIVSESDNKNVGSFTMSAVDASNNIGTLITDGNIFIVDTEKPPAPENLKTTVTTSGHVELDWYYDGEEVDYFAIYRATESGVSFVDFLARGTETASFLDTDTVNQVSYYYRVSAVDKAGNEGELSPELFATVERVEQAVVTTQDTVEETKQEAIEDQPPKVLPPALLPKVNAHIKEIDRVLLEVEQAIKDLNNEKDPQVQDLANTLGIAQGLETTQANLDQKKIQTNELKLRYRTETELDIELTKLDQDLKRMDSTPKSVKILENSEFDQTLSKEDIEVAVNELLVNAPLSEDEKADYIKKNQKFREKLPVKVTAKSITITNLDGTSKDHTFITKFISYPDAQKLTDVNVIEIIPKTIAEHVDLIDFVSDKYEVLEEDPIVKFGFLEFNYLGETISYSVQKQVDIEAIKNSKTVPLISLSDATASGSSITGFSLFDSFSLGSMQSMMITIGLVMIIGLFLYYMVAVKEVHVGLMQSFNSQRAPSRPSRPLSPQQVSMHMPPEFPTHEREKLLHDLSSHITSAKQEMADKLIPMVMDMHQKIEASKPQTSPELLMVHQLLKQAHTAIDAGQQSQAQTLYKRIRLAYPLLDKQAKHHIAPLCADLHKRLSK